MVIMCKFAKRIFLFSRKFRLSDETRYAIVETLKMCVTHLATHTHSICGIIISPRLLLCWFELNMFVDITFEAFHKVISSYKSDKILFINDEKTDVLI